MARMTTRAKTTKTTEPVGGDAPPAPVRKEPEPRVPERDFATDNDIDDTIDEREVFLPVMRKWVIVRVLESPEVARLEYLPDVVGYSDLIEKAAAAARARGGDGSDGPVGVDQAEFAEQNAVYLAAIAHAAVRHPDAGATPVRCPDCKNKEHVRSLWSLGKTKRLHQVDISVIVDTALSAGVAREMRPFSTDETPSGSSVPAATGT